MLLARALRRHAGGDGKVWKGISCFSSALARREKALPPRRVIDENEITESFLKGSGPGGQKINKTSSAVQLKHAPTGIVVKCQETRSRDQNRKLARQILGERLDELEKGEESRTAIKTKRAQTKKASAAKKSRRKYRKLEDEKAAQADASGPREDVDLDSTPEHPYASPNVERGSDKP
jgi:protein subunit release factor B